jgi:hypothetical protein
MRIFLLNGLCIVGKLPFTESFLDVQLLSFNWSKKADQFVLFSFTSRVDFWKDEHNPMLRIELEVINCYNAFIIHR